MKTKTLTLSDPQLLAEFVRQDEFRAFFEKRIEVPPDHLGLLMRNGQFVQALKGAHFTAGGLWTQLKGLIGGSHSISLMLADLKTFSVTSDFNAVTKDKVDIVATATIELQLNPDKPQNILGMMTARKALAKHDVALRLRPHLSDRVYEAAVSRVDANEVRGNRGLQDMIQADVMKEVERIAGDLGLLIRSVSVEWALNEVEIKEIRRASALREAESLEFEFTTLKRAMERETETTELKIESKLGLDKLESQSVADLERLVLDQDISFADAREMGRRVDEMKELEHGINMLRTGRLEKFTADLQTATHQGVDLKVIEERKRKIERETAALDTENRLQLRALEREYDRETRNLDRDEQRGNRLEDREDTKVQRKEDRDYDYDTRDKDIGIKGKERDFGFETRRKEVDVNEKEKYSTNDIQRDSDKVALEKLKGLAGLEAEQERERLQRKIREADAAHDREVQLKKLEAQREIDNLQLGSKMTPEQILAAKAGLSPEVGKILEEQAKAQAAGNTQAMDLMRQMVEQANRGRVQSEEQARAMFDMGMKGAVGVAAGAGGKTGVDGEAIDPGARVDCPKCGRNNAAKARFCVGCGEQLRN